MDLGQIIALLANAKPMRAQQVLPGIYDPTGLGFEHQGGGLSSELNGVEVGPDGQWRMYPSLVPGQTGIESILAGKPLTREQAQKAYQYAMTRKSEVPTFKSLAEALDYEKRRHEGLDKGYLPSRPEDLLSALLLALPSSGGNR